MRYWRTVIRTSITAVVAIAVILLAMLWLSGTFRSGKVAPAKLALPTTTPAAAVATVERISLPHQADVVGSVQSESRTTISSRLTAAIQEMRVRAGDRVKKGDVLVQLDDRDVKARVAQARETLRAAEATRDLAQIEVDRLTPLVKQNAASKNELDLWQAKLAAAAADVLRAQQAIRESEVTLSDTLIAAPFDGVVVDRLAEPGDMAAPGRPLLTLYDPSRLRLEASVRESYIGQLKLHQPLPVYLDALKQERQGTVEEIVPAADPASRSFLVKVHLPDPAGLYPGMFGRLRIPMSLEERLVIPATAVEEVGQLNLVTVVSDHHRERRSVRLGHEMADRVEVLAGLSEGEQVAVSTK